MVAPWPPVAAVVPPAVPCMCVVRAASYTWGNEEAQRGWWQAVEEHVELTRESARLMFDWLKHLATLSVGSIVGISALLKALFTDPKWIWLVATALVCLLFAMGASVFSMLYAVNLRVPPGMLETEENHEDRLFARKAYYRLALFAPWSFVVAIACFTTFAVRNLF